MLTHRWIIALLLASLICLSLTAQAQKPTLISHCPYVNHQASLACLIPSAAVTGASNRLQSFNTTVAQVLGQLPLAVPVSGFALTFDKTLGIPVVSSENLGSVLTERGETIGKHKIFLGFTFQRFAFETVDGVKLNNLPIVFQSQDASVFGTADNHLAANIDQYTAVAAFGLTDRIDVSMMLPIERISMSASASNFWQAPATSGPATQYPDTQKITGSANGPGDLVVSVKATLWKGERLRLAGGTEVRFPTGDEFNLLGSGAYGVKPFIVLSRRGRITPHANLGYQWNGESVLYPSSSGGNLNLPGSLQYSGGVDVGVVKRLTVVADLLGQHFFDAPRVTGPDAATSQNVPGLPNALTNLGFALKTIAVRNEAYDEDALGVGIKVNPAGRLLISANVLIKLNEPGLRARFVPLAGISYKF